MTARRVRLAQSIAMVAILLLPFWNELNGHSISVLGWIVGSLAWAPGPGRFLVAIYPTLVVLAFCLFLWPKKWIRVLYRVMLSIYVPLQWLFTVANRGSGLEVGYWALPIVASAAVLVEALVIVRERKVPSQPG